MPSVVWIVNDAGHDYEKVKELISNAELKPLTLDNVNPLYIDRLQQHLARAIAKFVHAEDYLLISGTPMVNAAAYALWLMQFGACNLVQWNAKKREYQLTRIEEGNMRRILEQQMVR